MGIGTHGLTARRQLAFRHVLPDNLTDNILSQSTDAEGRKTFSNASLPENHIWRGNAENLPESVEFDHSTNEAKYIVQQPSYSHPINLSH